ncbi:MAG: dihydrolipoamide acetyltransferase family protein [Sedimentibacter sp.]|uniref:dihydrolipoamide acetyltransferase family protein n=1 Tax=Sedimentibacter sp. TaxID=1960295 RepID=UPI0031597A76
MTEQNMKFKEKKIKGMRKTIAENMAYSSRESAAITQTRTADVTELIDIRKARKEEYNNKGIDMPSINDMVIKAAALALREHPDLNSTFQDNIIKTYEDINISMAVALPNGLITPVIRNADKLSLHEISIKTKLAADKARTGGLTADDITGGTFTITNVGMVKVETATPIINSPQVAILAAGTIVPRLERIEGEIVERQRMFLSLTVDHRIIDGYPAALYLNTVCDILEKPEQLWV